jgi:microcompartment protein CcmL/EutN
MGRAIGMLETYGLLPAIEGLDAALKAANVSLRSFDYVSGGLLAWFVEGEVGAVRVAVDAGKAAASRLGKVISHHVIPRPAQGVADSLPPPRRPGGRKGGTGIHKRDFPASEAARQKMTAAAQDDSASQIPVVAALRTPDISVSPAPENTAVKRKREELEAMNVGALRATARQTAGIALSRIQIRDARKETLINAILGAGEKTGG